jgi:hypothetical protein
MGTTAYLAPSIDSIGEVVVLVSNFRAEYGFRAGGQLNVFFKSGTNQFYGAFYFMRHEKFDANGRRPPRNRLTRRRNIETGKSAP